SLSLRGEMDDFRNPKITADYDARIHTQDFAEGARPLTLAGDILFSGKLHYRNARKQSFLLNLSVDGQVAGATMSASFRDTLLKIPRLHARYQLADGNFQARSAAIGLLGGRVTADLEIKHLDTTPNYRVAASFQQISLEEIHQAARGRQPRHLTLLGTLEGTAEVAWIGAISNVISNCDLHLHSTANDTIRLSDKFLPVNGAIRLSYHRLHELITFRETKLQVSSITLTLQGEVSDHSNLQIHAAAPELQRLSSLISAFRPGEPSLNEISGSAELNGMVKGAMQEPRLIGQLSGNNLRIYNSRWSSAKGTVQLSASEFVLQSAFLVGASQGKAFLSGCIGLRNWLYTPSNSFRVIISMNMLHVSVVVGRSYRCE